MDTALPVKFYPLDAKAFTVGAAQIETDSIMRVFVDMFGKARCILIIADDKVLVWRDFLGD